MHERFQNVLPMMLLVLPSPCGVHRLEKVSEFFQKVNEIFSYGAAVLKNLAAIFEKVAAVFGQSKLL